MSDAKRGFRFTLSPVSEFATPPRSTRTRHSQKEVSGRECRLRDPDAEIRHGVAIDVAFHEIEIEVKLPGDAGEDA